MCHPLRSFRAGLRGQRRDSLLPRVNSAFVFRQMLVSGGAPIYLELVRSRALLEPIALDTVTVTELGGRRVALTDLLGVDPEIPARRLDRTVHKLESIVSAREDKGIGAVRLSVATPWASVSLWIAEQLVSGADKFNLKTRKSQAGEERRFVEERATEAERALRLAEDRLQSFRPGDHGRECFSLLRESTPKFLQHPRN